MNRIPFVLGVFFAVPVGAQPITAAETAAVDSLVAKTLADTGVPSASIAIVRDGRIVLTKAYGKASERIPVARPDLRYQIASNSKQFTAMGLLLLEDEGKLSLDDPISKWLPGISGGDSIRIRQLLSHTSGVQDFWPQDYDFEAMARATTPQGIVDRWAKKPLDYAPGSRWQYSNTGYVIAGMILEKAAREPLMTYLTRKIFTPLDMHPVDIDDSNGPDFPTGYHRAALGPVRVAKPAARGWLWAAGELSLTAADLAKWDIARLDRAPLIPADDWAEQERAVLLPDGTTTGYGLGVDSGVERNRRIVAHNGESVGFLSQNTVYPDSRAAIVVLTNSDFSDAVGTITDGLEKIVLAAPEASPVAESDRMADVTALYAALAAGKADPTLMTDNLRYYFTPTTTADYAASLAPLGRPKIAIKRPPSLRGGFVNRNYTLTFPGRALTLVTYAEPGANGRWEQFMIMPE